jgi:hypothetical protein
VGQSQEDAADLDSVHWSSDSSLSERVYWDQVKPAGAVNVMVAAEK